MFIHPFLMSRLHNEEARAGGYNFEAVRNNDNRIDGGLTALDKLYIPINSDNAHWIFIKVAIYAKTIQLFDSQGGNDDNDKYLKAVKNYMYDTLTTNVEGEMQDVGAWRQE